MFQIIVFSLINITMVQAWCLLKPYLPDLDYDLLVKWCQDALFLTVPDGSWLFLMVPDCSWLFLIVPDCSCLFLIIPDGDHDRGSYQVVQSLSRAVAQGRLKMALTEVK